MAVPVTTTLSGPYAADDVNRIWNYGFSVSSKEHIRLEVTDLLGVTVVVSAGLFEASGVGEPSGGAVTYPIAPVDPLPAGYTVVLRADTPYDQPTVISNQGKFYPKVIEGGLDHLARQNQQIANRLTVAEQLIAGLVTLAPPGPFIDAAAVTVTPGFGVTSVNVQAALVELQTEINGKALTVHTHAQSDITGLAAALVAKLDTSILTGKGDILCRTSTLPTKRTVGSNGLCLKADSTDPTGLSWGRGGVASRDFYDASATWTKPAGLSADSMVFVQVWGAGGGGGRGPVGIIGGGGGGGCYLEKWLLASDLGATVTVTIGAGGAAAASGAVSAGAGGTSQFGSHVIAYGGGGGSTLSGGGGGGGISAGTTPSTVATSALQGRPRWEGGLGGTDGAPSGTAGAGGGTASGGDSLWGGAGGGTPAGASLYGGDGGLSVVGTAGAGVRPGGGGGAASDTGTAGKGGDGRVIVTVFN